MKSTVQQRFEELMEMQYYPLTVYWYSILSKYAEELSTKSLITPYGVLRSLDETLEVDPFSRRNPLREWVRNVRSRIFVEGNIIACEPLDIEDDESVDKARTAEEFLQELIKTKQLDLEEVIRQALLFFSSFVVVYPDAIPSAKIVVHPSYDVAIDIDGMSYIVRHVLPLTKALTLIPSLKHFTGILEEMNVELIPGKFYLSSAVILYEHYYYKPSQDVWVREVYTHNYDVVLDRRIFPIKPIHQFKCENSSTPYGTSPVVDIYPVAEIESVYFNKLAEYIKKMPLSIVYIPVATAKTNNIEDRAMEGQAILELKISGLDSGSKPLETWTSPLLDGNKLQGWQLVRSWVNDASGLSDIVLRSQAPRRVYTFSGLQFLYTQDLSRLASIKSNLEKMLVELSYTLLKYADRFKFLDISLNKKILAHMPLEVKVKAIMENGIPENRLMKQRLVMELMQLGISKFLSPLEQRKLLTILEFPSLNKVLEIEPVVETTINKENILLESGYEVPVLPFENHAYHIEGHQRYLTKHKLEWLNDPQKIQNFMNHIMNHFLMLQKLQGGELSGEGKLDTQRSETQQSEELPET